MGMQSTTIQQTQVYAQETQPTDTRDGVLWVDTSVSPRQTYVYSTTSGSWESVKPSETQTNLPIGGGYYNSYTGQLTLSGTANEVVWSDTVDIPDSGYDGLKLHVANVDYGDVDYRMIDSVRFREEGGSWTTEEVHVAETDGTVELSISPIYAEEMQVSVTSTESSGSNTEEWTVTLHEMAVGPHQHPV